MDSKPRSFKPEKFMVQMKGRDTCLAQPSLGMDEPAVAGDSTNRAWERDTTHGRTKDLPKSHPSCWS